jgi:arginyl-tRNA synthetase
VRLELAEELELVRQMIQFNDVLVDSVRELEPHRMVFYLLELAGEFHRYYNRHRVISDDVGTQPGTIVIAGERAEDNSSGARRSWA